MATKEKVVRQFTMSADALKVAIGAVYRAASPDETRAHLHSVHIVREGASLRFIATNGFWMAIYTVLAADGQPCEWEATLDLADAVAITKRKSFGEVVVDFDAKLAAFVDGTAKLNIVDCSYPPWRQVYPKEADKGACDAIGFNPLFMTPIHESFAAILGKPKKGNRFGADRFAICLEPGSNLGPMRITCSAASELEIVLMPAKQPPTPWTIGKIEASKEKKSATA
jgi:hypothetical protein